MRFDVLSLSCRGLVAKLSENLVRSEKIIFAAGLRTKKGVILLSRAWKNAFYPGNVTKGFRNAS